MKIIKRVRDTLGFIWILFCYLMLYLIQVFENLTNKKDLNL